MSDLQWPFTCRPTYLTVTNSVGCSKLLWLVSHFIFHNSISALSLEYLIRFVWFESNMSSFWGQASEVISCRLRSISLHYQLSVFDYCKSRSLQNVLYFRQMTMLPWPCMAPFMETFICFKMLIEYFILCKMFYFRRITMPCHVLLHCSVFMKSFHIFQNVNGIAKTIISDE